MAKHGESESDVLSPDEMKHTKGGAGPAVPAPEEAMRRRRALDPGVVDRSLEAEALDAMPTAEQVVGAAPPPTAQGKK
jgi:hypothetical protein